jgi:hypothetical protein
VVHKALGYITRRTCETTPRNLLALVPPPLPLLLLLLLLLSSRLLGPEPITLCRRAIPHSSPFARFARLSKRTQPSTLQQKAFMAA